MRTVEISATRSVVGPRPARPARPARPGRVRGGVSSCRVAATAPAVGVTVKLKLLAVAALAVLGTGVAVGGFIDQAQPDPQVDIVAGDPGWAHVTRR